MKIRGELECRAVKSEACFSGRGCCWSSSPCHCMLSSGFLPSTPLYFFAHRRFTGRIGVSHASPFTTQFLLSLIFFKKTINHISAISLSDRSDHSDCPLLLMSPLILCFALGIPHVCWRFVTKKEGCSC